jgi:hypothetical protein
MDQGKHAKVVLDDAETPTASDGEVQVKVAVIAREDESRQEFSRWFFEEYVPKGLESGLIVPTRPQVVAVYRNGHYSPSLSCRMDARSSSSRELCGSPGSIQ